MDSEGACQTVTEQMTNRLVTSTPYWARPQKPHLCGHCLGIGDKVTSARLIAQHYLWIARSCSNRSIAMCSKQMFTLS